MKKILMLSVVFLFFVVNMNAQGVRDDNSYYIHFTWSDSCPGSVPTGGYGFTHGNHIGISAARTTSGFNVYAKNRLPDEETGAPIENHSAYPVWYINNGWDVPDAAPDYDLGAPYYLVTIDTYQNKWWLFYSEYPKTGMCDLYVPMSGYIQKVVSNSDGTFDLILIEEGGNWKLCWVWGCEDVPLQDRILVAHLDLAGKTGYIVPSQLLPK